MVNIEDLNLKGCLHGGRNYIPFRYKVTNDS